MSSVLYDALGPRARRRARLGSALAAVLLAGLVGLALQRLAGKGTLDPELWRLYGNPDFLRLLARGMSATLQAAAAAMVLAVLVGGLLAVGRLSQRWWVRAPVRAWVEFFRGMPLLLLILFLYLGLPALGLPVPVFWALVLGLALYNSAVIGEIFRAGILSLPKGQSEAAYAIGLTHTQTLALVLVPQAVRRMLPALVSQLVTLLKDTSLGFVISYGELLRSGRGAVESLGGRYSVVVYTGVAALYIAVNMTLSWVARWLDRRTQRQYGRTVHVGAADEAA
ncbi:MAG: amino acid ABC transporter permease [Actinomycetota bacterium]